MDGVVLLYLQSGRYAPAVWAFTRAVESHGGSLSPSEQQVLASLYGHRAEALHALGAYGAAARDAGMALVCEECARASYAGEPRRPAGGAEAAPAAVQRGLALLRAKALRLRGDSRLREGSVKGVEEDLEASFGIAEKALEEATDLSDGDPTDQASFRDAMAKAKEGLTDLKKHNYLMAQLKSGSYTKNYHSTNGLALKKLLDGVLEVAPGAIKLHVAKVKYLVDRRQWTMVACHCEQVAARAARWDGVFDGDLADVNPFVGIPPLQELDPEFFAEHAKRNTGTPSYLRVMSPQATSEAVLRMPLEVLPHYLRALRLEERFEAAILAIAVLREFDEDNARRFARERETLLKTQNLMEGGDDAQYRDARYDRAVALYGECLTCNDVEESGSSDGGSDAGSFVPPPGASASRDRAPAHEPGGGRLHAVLHFKRAACFAAMDRSREAATESSRVLDIHSAYTSTLLLRAQQRVKLGRANEARLDFVHYVTLVEEVRACPYIPSRERGVAVLCILTCPRR